jgi:methylglutamate dehydrogenase subunit D
VSDPVLTARAALDRTAQPGSHGQRAAAPGVTLGECRYRGVVSLIARKGMAAAIVEAARAAYGVALPLTPRCEGSGALTFIWAGPERWLVIAEKQSSEALAQSLASVFAGLAAIAEQGDGRTIIRISGPRARDVLAKILAIDLHPRAFRPGDTAITGAAHIEVQIWQIDDAPRYEIALFRGFAGSFWHWLVESAAAYGYEVVAA